MLSQNSPGGLPSSHSQQRPPQFLGTPPTQRPTGRFLKHPHPCRVGPVSPAFGSLSVHSIVRPSTPGTAQGKSRRTRWTHSSHSSARRSFCKHRFERSRGSKFPVITQETLCRPQASQLETSPSDSRRNPDSGPFSKMTKWPSLQPPCPHHIHPGRPMRLHSGSLFVLTSPLSPVQWAKCYAEEDAGEQQGGLLPLNESRTLGVAGRWSWMGVAGQAPVTREAQRRRPATGIVGGA